MGLQGPALGVSASLRVRAREGYGNLGSPGQLWERARVHTSEMVCTAVGLWPRGLVSLGVSNWEDWDPEAATGQTD